MNRVVGTALLLLAAAGGSPALASSDEARLRQAVGAITAADFRGERARLRELASGLEQVKKGQLAAYREYWRGFALWRSAINGANATPAPSDVRSDLEGAIEAFRAAERLAPDWIEPKIGLLFSWTGLAYVPGGVGAAVSAEEFVAVRSLVRDKAQDNPRALWFFGGALLFAPKDRGGDPARAAETYRRGVAAARSEALARAETPAWIPAWGAAENLMSLAYLYSHAEPVDRTLARAYADGALAVAPDWHYVRDILTPLIEALPDGGRVAAEAEVEKNKAVARRFLQEAFGPRWSLELVEELHTPDFVLHTRSGEMGLREDREALLGWRVASPDLTMRVDGIVGEGDAVAVRWTATGTNTGAGNGLPATGRPFSTSGTTFWRFKDGKIAEEWGVVDMLSLLKQLGQLPAQP